MQRRRGGDPRRQLLRQLVERLRFCDAKEFVERVENALAIEEGQLLEVLDEGDAIVLRGLVAEVPVHIRLRNGYPTIRPLCYVDVTHSCVVARHKNVDQYGQIYLESLASEEPRSLVTILREMKKAFANPPLQHLRAEEKKKPAAKVTDVATPRAATPSPEESAVLASLRCGVGKELQLQKELAADLLVCDRACEKILRYNERLKYDRLKLRTRHALLSSICQEEEKEPFSALKVLEIHEVIETGAEDQAYEDCLKFLTDAVIGNPEAHELAKIVEKARRLSSDQFEKRRQGQLAIAAEQRRALASLTSG